MKTIHAADLFCGAGGTSTGLYRAADDVGVRVNLLAVNHWNVAIATHSSNHLQANHLCETLDGVNPRKVVPGGRLRLLVASPECTHHSTARGGRPMSDQSRASAWHVVRWAEALRIDDILVENVREFLTWGPLGRDGRPIKSRRGATFRAWVAALESLNYRVEHRVLCAADYGDPTTRQRLFVRARLGRGPIRWPAPSHAPEGAGGLAPWLSARDHVVDWEDRGVSIFNRKRPLSPNTVRRIAAGMWKFSGLDLREFLDGFMVQLYGTGTARSARRPLPTVTARGNHTAIAQPVIIPQNSTGAPRPVSKPVPTLTTTSRGVGLAQPFILPKRGRFGKNAPRSVDDPAQTVIPHHGLGNLVEPFVLGQQSGSRARSTAQPLPTVAQGGAISKVEPILVEYYGTSDAASVDAPIGAVTSKPHHGVAEPFIVAHFGEREGQEPRTHSVDGPAPTVTRRGAGDLVQPAVIVGAGGPARAGRPRSVDKPLGTVVGKNSRGVGSAVILSAGGPKVPARPVSAPANTVLARDHMAIAEPVIVDVNHGEDGKTGKPEGRAQSVRAPLRTVTGTRGKGVASVHGIGPATAGGRVARAAMVQVELEGKPHRALELTFEEGGTIVIDILFRMLRARELARAQGFPDAYAFSGDTQEEVVRQIGNAVPVNLSAALCRSVLAR